MSQPPPLSILLVEDDAETREILAGVLAVKFPEFVIQAADNGKTALDAYRKYSPAIVITDINMPVMDGISLAREIKAIKADVKLIVLTAFSDKNIQMYTDAIEVEVDHYIQKPTDYGKLFSAVKQCVSAIGPENIFRPTPPDLERKPDESPAAKNNKSEATAQSSRIPLA